MNTSSSGENEVLLKLENAEGKMDEFIKRSKEDLNRSGMLKISSNVYQFLYLNG